MTNALLSILVPAVSPDGKAEDQSQLPIEEALHGTSLDLEAGSSAFAQVLAQHQKRLDPAQKLALIQEGAPQAAAKPSMKLAALIFPQVANAMEEGELPKGAAELLETIEQMLPEISHETFSLIAQPVIAYTTDAEVAAVAVMEEDVAALGGQLPSPKQALHAFPELAAMIKTEHTGEVLPQQSAPATNIPATNNIPGTDIEVTLPEYPVATLPSDESDAQALADEQAGQVAPVVAPVGGPLVEETTKPGVEPMRIQDGTNAQAKPAAVGDVMAGAKQEGGDAGARQQQNGSQQQGGNAYHPLGADTDLLSKTETLNKPAPVSDGDDFKTLLNDKTITPQPIGGQGPQASNPHAVDAQGRTPLMKMAHAAPETPVEEQISVRIRQAVSDGMDRITIKLQPVELGKLQIKLDIAQDGRAQVLVTADNRDTFQLLQRDARGLEQALAEAGLETGAGDLQFDLREQPGQQHGNASDFEQDMSAYDDADELGEQAALTEDTPLPLQQVDGEYTLIASDGVDIRV